MRKSIEKQSLRPKSRASRADRLDRPGCAPRLGLRSTIAGMKAASLNWPKPPRAPGVSLAPDSVSLSFIVQKAAL